MIGYRGADTIPDPSNPTAAIADPKASPYRTVETLPYYLAVATVKYSWKINDHLNAEADLLIDNLFNNREVHYYGTTQRPPGGDVTNPSRIATPSTFSYQIPRTASVTVSVRY